MVRATRGMIPAITVLGLSAIAMAAEPTTEELKARVDALQAKVEALEAKQANAADVDATVRRVLEDADRRSQLLAVEGFTAGYTADKGFVLQSSDGAFLLHPYIQFQFRNATNWREDQKSTGGDDIENGFEVRRLKFGVDGNAYNSNLTYQFQWATDRSNGSVSLEDAWAKYQFQPSWAIQAGQFKDPLFHESQVGATKQLAADRSMLNAILEGSDNYVQGVNLYYGTKDRLHTQLAFTDGFNGSNSNFLDPQGGDLTDAGYAANNNKKYNFGIAGRADYMLLGDPNTSWKRYSAFSAQGVKADDPDLLVLGAAGEWDQAGDGNYYWYTADAQYQPTAITGLSIYGAFVGRYSNVDEPIGAQQGSASDWGALIQAGYMVTSRIEPFARYDYTWVESQDIYPAATAEAYGTHALHEITAGVNYYLYGHNAKLTLDVSYLPNGSPFNLTGQDILRQATENNQFLARVQFQLVL